MIKETRKLIANSNSFLLSTCDRNGFPHTIVVSKPIIRTDFYSLKFYVDGTADIVKNIQENNKGNVCCYNEGKFESLLMKGIFSIHSIEEYLIIKERLNDYQKFLKHENPVILSFEVYGIKIHPHGATEITCLYGKKN